MKAVTKGDFVDSISEEMNCPREMASKFITAFIHTMQTAVSSGRDVEIRGLFSTSVKTREWRARDGYGCEVKEFGARLCIKPSLLLQREVMKRAK